MASSNGSGFQILTSQDKSTWTNIGTIPSNFGGNIVKTKVTNTRAKFVKLSRQDIKSWLFQNIKERFLDSYFD